MGKLEQKTGLFVVVEGIDGSGKSSQVELLMKRFLDDGYDVIKTREPGGTPEAEFLRKEVVSDTGRNWSAIEELLLFTAARHHHVNNKIKPALAAGKIVISDRFVPSTIAYQGAGRGVGIEKIRHLTRIAIGDFDADLTFLFFVDPEIGIARTQKRMGNETRFEDLDMDFHRRVYAGYESIFHEMTRGVATSLRTCFRIDDNDYTYLPSVEDKISAITDNVYARINTHIKRNHIQLKKVDVSTTVI